MPSTASNMYRVLRARKEIYMIAIAALIQAPRWRPGISAKEEAGSEYSVVHRVIQWNRLISSDESREANR